MNFIEFIKEHWEYFGVATTFITAFFGGTKLGRDIISGIVVNSVSSLFIKFFNLFKKQKKEYTSYNNTKKISENDIINHDIFNYMDFWLYNHIPSIDLRTKYRTAVFRKYLHIYVSQYKNSLNELVKEGKYKDMESSELRKTLLKIITNTILKIEIEMRSSGLPEVIIVKMKNSLDDTFNLKMDLTNSICDSTFYDGENNYLKVYSFLNIIHSILDNVMSSIEPILNKLNGELSGLSMDGFIEPKSHKNKE
jgi:hypothetical protein